MSPASPGSVSTQLRAVPALHGPLFSGAITVKRIRGGSGVEVASGNPALLYTAHQALVHLGYTCTDTVSLGRFLVRDRTSPDAPDTEPGPDPQDHSARDATTFWRIVAAEVVQEADATLAEAVRAARAAQEADATLLEAMRAARLAGNSWTAVAVALGTTVPEAQRRFAGLVD